MYEISKIQHEKAWKYETYLCKKIIKSLNAVYLYQTSTNFVF